MSLSSFLKISFIYDYKDQHCGSEVKNNTWQTFLKHALYFFPNKTLFSTGVKDNRLFVYTINRHILHLPGFDSVALITCMHELSTET